MKIEVATTTEPSKNIKSSSAAKPLNPTSRRWPKLVLVAGVALLIAGVALFVVKMISGAALRDANTLIEVGTWQREDAPEVIWTFTEMGKGTLTSNGHQNDYDFLWHIDGDTLKLEIKWLYDIESEYTYHLDGKTLSLKQLNPEGDLANINFRATSSVDAEITENN